MKVLKNFKIIQNFFYLFFNNKFIFVLLIAYLLLSLAPLTNADTLDYHAGVALKSLLANKFVTLQSWMTSTNASSGEIFIAFSFFNKSEQLPSIVNFYAIFIIVSIFKKVFFGKEKNFLIILMISSPAILSLVSTAKPQLIFIASNLLAFHLIFNNFNNKNFFLIIFLLGVSFVGKYNFILSSSFIYLLMLIKNFKDIKTIIFHTIIIFFIIVFPHYFYKLQNYEMNFFQFIFYPTPISLSGYDGFYEHLRGGGPISFPLNIFHPFTMSHFNEGLGAIFFILIFNFILNIKKILKKHKLSIVLAFLFMLPLFLLKNTMARYFLEFSFFLSYICFFKTRHLQLISIIKMFVYLQYSVVLIISLTTGIILFSGSLNNKLKSEIKKNFANEYQIFTWANSILPKEAILLSYPRSISLSNVETYSLDFLRFANENHAHYLNQLKKYKPNYILSYNKLDKIKNICVKNLYSEKKNLGKYVSRNIFQKRDSYDAYIYTIDYNKLQNCFKI